MQTHLSKKLLTPIMVVVGLIGCKADIGVATYIHCVSYENRV